MDKPKIQISVRTSAFYGIRPAWFYIIPRINWLKWGDEFGLSIFWLVFWFEAERREEQHGIWLKKRAIEKGGDQ